MRTAGVTSDSMELQGSPMQELPDALILAIMQQHMDLGTLLTVGAVCSRFKQLAAQALLGVALDEYASASRALLAVLDGSWRSHLFLAARRRSQNPATARAAVAAERLDFSSFCVPDGKATSSAQILVTDGLRLKMLDSSLRMLQGHIPPQFQHSPHRPFHEHIPCPVPVGSVPELHSLRLLLLQPVAHGARHLQQLQQAPHMYGQSSTWAPMFLSPCQPSSRLEHLVRSQFLTHWSKHVNELPRSPQARVGSVAQSSSYRNDTPNASTAGRRAVTAGSTSSLEAVQTAAAAQRDEGSSTSLTQPQQQHDVPNQPAGTTTSAGCNGMSEMALIVPRLPLWCAEDKHAHGSGSSSSKSSRKGHSLSPRNSKYCPEAYDMQSDLALQLLSRALALPCSVTYLDISNHSGLQDHDLSLLLTKCNKQLEHLVAAGTQLGPMCLMMLGTLDRLNLKTLDLSYSCAHTQAPAHTANAAGSASSASRSHRPPASLMKSQSNSLGHTRSSSLTDMSSSSSTSASLRRHAGGNFDSSSLSKSPPISLVSGAAVMEAGLRHRHPSALLANSLAAPDKATPMSLPGAPGAVAQRDSRRGTGMQSDSFYIRLLRSALGRLTQLTELRLAGNNLDGLFDPPTSLHAAASAQPQHVSARTQDHALGLNHNTLVVDSIPVANGQLYLVEQTSSPSLQVAPQQAPVQTGARQQAVTAQACSPQSQHNRLAVELDKVQALEISSPQGPQLDPPSHQQLTVEGSKPAPQATTPCPSPAPISAPSSAQPHPHLSPTPAPISAPSSSSPAPSLASTPAPCLAHNAAPVTASAELKALEDHPSLASGLEAGLLACLSRLRVLDLSHAHGLSAANLHMLLSAATNLEELYVHGCLSLATDCTGSPAHGVDISRDSETSLSEDHSSRRQTTQPAPKHGRQKTATEAATQTTVQQEGRVRVTQQCWQPQHEQHVCQLRKLSVGWGCSSRLLRQLCNAAQERLTSLQLGVGCAVTDDALVHIAATCTALQKLHVQLGNISEKGVQAVLGQCTKLHHLILEQCIGPFTAAMLPPTSSQHQSLHRWTLSTLVLYGPTVMLNDQQLRVLIGSRPNTLQTLALTNCPLLTPGVVTWVAATHGGSLQHLRLEQVTGGCSSTTTSITKNVTNITIDNTNNITNDVTNSHSVVGSRQVGELHSHGPPNNGTQHSASVSSIPNLGTGNQHMGQTAPSSMGSAPVNGKVVMSTSASRQRPVMSAWRLREQDVLGLLASCPILQTFRLRHCCQLSSNFVAAVTDACPLLHHLTLDQCDLADKGLHITQSPYSPLQQVQVCRCKYVEPALTPQLPDICPTPTQLECSDVGPACRNGLTPTVTMHAPPSLLGPSANHNAAGSRAHGGIQGISGTSQSASLKVDGAAAVSMLQRLRRRVDSDVMVHDLLEGRTTVLQA